jgi:hypothetical protein
MPDFSVILQTPEIRAITQEGILERAFHDALFPRMLYRGEAAPVPWPAGIGDSMIFTAPGLIPPDMTPLVPGTDPTPVNYPMEQWTAQLQQYAGTMDTHMPTSMQAIADLFLRNSHQLGLQAAQTLNRKVRNQMYNTALAGHTVADGSHGAVATLRVKRLNGFTRARSNSGSKVAFNLVSSTNPLAVSIYMTGGAEARNVIGFTPDTAGDETGPGTLTLSAVLTTGCADRAYVIADDRTFLVRVGGGLKVDDLTASTDIPTLADVRAAVAHLWEQNVPEHPDGRFHCHLDPVSQSKIFSDDEFQRLLTALPDHYMYRQFALGELLGTVFFRNSESPIPSSVVGGLTATFDQRDPFAGELFNTGAITGAKVHRMLFTAQGGIYEYYSDLANLLTEAGITGKVGEPKIVNNGIEVFSERIQLIIRGPLNRLQDTVATSWKIIADWPARTDAAVGDASRYKRFVAVEHTE